MTASQGNRAYVTLVRNDSDLLGAIILAYTLNQCKSRYPLVVLVSPSLTKEALNALETEARLNPTIMIQQVQLLQPQEDNTGMAAIRSIDIYTKLRAFELHNQGFQKCVFLDPDMVAFQTPDELFDIRLPDKSWIAASHTCVCNLDSDSFAPEDWHKSNCAYTPLHGPNDPPTRVTPSSRVTYHLLNSGMFVYEPNETLWETMLHELDTSDKIKNYKFPDQDFMADLFRNRWLSLSWRFNALNTMRYGHPRMYRDDHVVLLHYILDKPWNRRIASDKIAGHLGRDGVTHQQWWDIYQDWNGKRKIVNNLNAHAIATFVENLLPPSLTPEADDQQVAENKRFDDGSGGGKISSKPLGTPPGEISDVSATTDHIPASRPYDYHVPISPSEYSQKLDEAAGLALGLLIANSSHLSSETLTESELPGTTTPEEDPEQYSQLALLYWCHKALSLESQLESYRHLAKVLETENVQLYAEVNPLRAATRHRFPRTKKQQPLFLIGPSSSSDSSPASFASPRRAIRDGSENNSLSSSPTQGVRARSLRERLLQSAARQPASPEEKVKFQLERQEWAADPNEVDQFSPEERVANVLGHTRSNSFPQSLIPMPDCQRDDQVSAETPSSPHIRFGGISRFAYESLVSGSENDNDSQGDILTRGTTTPIPFPFSLEDGSRSDHLSPTPPGNLVRSASSIAFEALAGAANAAANLLHSYPSVGTLSDDTGDIYPADDEDQ